MKKKITLLLASILMMAVLAGCSGNSGPDKNQAGAFEKSRDINVVSREDGSGTRGAFIELMEIQEKGANGSKTDKTTKDAIIANKTDVVMTNVAGDPYSIGYISLGSLNSTVKAVRVDSVEGTTENIKNGSYKVARPFNIATKGEPNGLAKDFIDYIFSAEGQALVANSYIAIDDKAASYSGNKPSGKIVVAGSSSVSPIMEKLIEGYTGINANAEIELQTSDSTAGMTGAIDGTCDIGMASRDLKDSEKEQLTGQVIAMDGIIVVVNNENPLDDLTSTEVKNIYIGNLTTWNEIVD